MLEYIIEHILNLEGERSLRNKARLSNKDGNGSVSWIFTLGLEWMSMRWNFSYLDCLGPSWLQNLLQLQNFISIWKESIWIDDWQNVNNGGGVLCFNKVFFLVEHEKRKFCYIRKARLRGALQWQCENLGTNSRSLNHCRLHPVFIFAPLHLIQRKANEDHNCSFILDYYL